MSRPRSTRRLARWPGGPRGIALLLAALLLGHGFAMAAEAATADPLGAAQAAAVLSLVRPFPATPCGRLSSKCSATSRLSSLARTRLPAGDR